MSHFALLWKARTIEKYRQKYENEKINSIIMSNSDIPETTIYQRLRHYRHGMQKRLSRTFSKWYPEGSTVSNFFVNLQTEMKFPSILLRSLYGFIGGILLTYLGFMFFVFQLSLSVVCATFLSTVMGVLLTLGLTFSNRMRCIIFLLVPQLFSRVGRYTLTCYALVLILTGPATNTLKNSEVLSESMACNQEQIKLGVREVNESIGKPFNSLKDPLKITMESMKSAVQKLRMTLIRISRLILSIASVIQSNFSWLGSVADECNETLGTPYEKCLKALMINFEECDEIYNLNRVKRKDIKNLSKNALKRLMDIIDFKYDKDNSKNKNYDKHNDRAHFKAENILRAKTKNYIDEKDIEISKGKGNVTSLKMPKSKSSVKPWFCNKRNVAEMACSSLKSYKKYCVPADFAEDTFLATIRKKIQTFVQRISTSVHVQLNIQHTYTFIGNSNSTNQVAAGIVTEIRNRADPILTWLSWSSCVTSLFLLLIIFRAKHYQHMFETRSRFDNRFITKEFRELDLKRLREGRETVLPLNRRERAKYVTTTSFRLVASEKLHQNRSAVFMTVTTFKLLIHIVADYSLYWVLMTIRHHGKLQSPLQPGIADTGAFITGSGFVARLLQSFIDTLNLQLALPPPDNSCLPNPYPPDFNRYSQIGFLIFLLWFFALFEPYGLRLRHLIMGHHRPQRAKARAIWLYNHILMTRATFMKFARRRLHREFKYTSESKFTFRRWLQTSIPYFWVRYLLGIKPAEEPYCLLCNINEDMNDPNKELIKCEVPDCAGTYCTNCFSDIGQLCTICLSPSDYGDLSDVTLEKGTSDEDNSDEEDSDDNNHDTNNQNYDNIRRRDISDDALENANDDGTCRTKTIGKFNDFFSLFGKNEAKCETTQLIQNSAVIYGLQNLELCGIEEKDTNVSLVQIVFNKNRCIMLYFGRLNTRNKQENYRKDYNNNIVHSPKHIPSFELLQYSVYEITNHPFKINKIKNTTQLAKYLRKKKIIRHQKKTAMKNEKIFTSSNNSINFYTINKEATDYNGKSTKYFKIVEKSKDKNNGLSNIAFKGSKNPAESSKNTRFKSNTIKPIREIRHANTKSFSTTLSKFWITVKSKVIPSRSLIYKKRNLPPTKEQKHKRKKKANKAKKLTGMEAKNSNKREAINSRVIAYLDDRFWDKNKPENQEQVTTFEKQTRVMNNGRVLERNITVNNVEIPRLNLSSLSESMSEPMKSNTRLKYNLSLEETSNKIHGTEYTACALERFFLSIVSSSRDFLENLSADDSKSKVDETNVRRIENSDPDTLHRVPMKRRLNDYSENNVQEKVRKGFLYKRLSTSVTLVKRLYSVISVRVKGKKETKQIRKEKRRSVCLQCNLQSHKTLPPEDKLAKKEREKNDYTEKKRKGDEKDNKQIQTIITSLETDDKAVTVFPMMNSCACQKGNTETQDHAVQITNARTRPISQGYDVGIMTENPTCSCAVQCREFKNTATACMSTRWSVGGKDLKKKEVLSPGNSYTDDSTSSEESVTTVARNHANVDYHTFRTGKTENVGRLIGKVVAQTNRSTMTDGTNYHDVSTTTYDWWSPIVEKKEILRKDNRADKKKRNYEDSKEKEKRVFKRKEATKEEKITFRKVQLMPTDFRAKPILTPSRYLLQSQKYYNELFTSPRVFRVANMQINRWIKSQK